MKNSATRVNICGTQVDRYSFQEVVDLIADYAANRNTPQFVVTPNAQHVVLVKRDALFRELYRCAFLVVPDGVPLLWAAKLFQTPLPERVNGTDLFEELCKVSAERGLKVFLLGGRPQSALLAAEVLQSKYSGLQVAGTYCPPYGFESDEVELKKINSILKKAAPEILFVALGSPKQEYWIYRNYQKISVPISIGIGASFEFVSGVVERAPKWMQKYGLEWLFRLLTEPRRLWRRYIIGNIIFLLLVLKQRFRFS